MLTLSLVFDHRLLDGAPAAKFLAKVKALLEQPSGPRDPMAERGAFQVLVPWSRAVRRDAQAARGAG